MNKILSDKAITLLKQLIATPSLSHDEKDAADLYEKFLFSEGASPLRYLNNVWAVHPDYRPGRFTLLLNSHLDTVKPVDGWLSDPFVPVIDNNRLTGLGANDAGGPLVALTAAFIQQLSQPQLPYNLIIAGTSEEENSGHDGVEAILDKLGPLDLAIVGEPTKMEMAIAEKGLMVIDCVASGRAGHAARNEGDNAILHAISDIMALQHYHFPKVSDSLGPVKLTVTQINAGYQHNIVPDKCSFVIDVRTNEHYTNEEVYNILTQILQSRCSARSFRLNASALPEGHPLVVVAHRLRIPTYASPTTSDQAVISCHSVKIGPGDSARSHTANEFVLLSEIDEGITGYLSILKTLGKVLLG